MSALFWNKYSKRFCECELTVESLHPHTAIATENVLTY